jgi:pilus assembly protein Flp/PilA
MKQRGQFFRNESGLELSEYAIAAALLALAVILAFTLLGGSITGALNKLADILSSALS